MDLRFGVKQFVAVVRGDYSRFAVFTTDDDRWYLFCQLLGESMTFTDLAPHPVRRADLQPSIRRGLARGVGNSL